MEARLMCAHRQCLQNICAQPFLRRREVREERKEIDRNRWSWRNVLSYYSISDNSLPASTAYELTVSSASTSCLCLCFCDCAMPHSCWDASLGTRQRWLAVDTLYFLQLRMFSPCLTALIIFLPTDRRESRSNGLHLTPLDSISIMPVFLASNGHQDLIENIWEIGFSDGS